MPSLSAATVADDTLFDWRWQRAEADLIAPLTRLYGGRVEMAAFRDRLRALLRAKWEARPADLRALDLRRDLNPRWFMDQRMAGYVFYIDRFCGTLKALPDRIPYLTDLGITYAHFMPCLKPRPGDSDGGYAVMDYGAIDPRLGDMDDFRAATAALREAGISTCIDMVLNHTAAEHDWAMRAKAGDPFYRAFYHVFDDDTLPRQYERTLLEVFPNQAPGNFTLDPEMGKWVWTTFNAFQWDLNWANPEVFLAILGIVLDLANAGAEVLRLDAVAFMWKRLGTVSQNEPEVHDILQAINQATSIAAPAIIHKAEAIVAPSDLVPYLGAGRHAGRVCNLAYHNSLMVQFWSALASGRTDLMADVLDRHFPDAFVDAQWATYIRCHDDIGWAVTEEDAERAGVTGPGHRAFLSDFYAGRFPGSFARGGDFQINDATGDRRTNGSFASLAGLEQAVELGDPRAIDLAVNRILMGHALIAAFGGMPLIYMGDELGLTNDHTYLDDPDRRGDSRWMQRPAMDWALAASAPLADAPHGWIWRGVRHLLAVRAATPELAGTVPTRILKTGHDRIFAFRRPGLDGTMTAIFNFADNWQRIAVEALGLDLAALPPDLITGTAPTADGGDLVLPPYGRLWLRAAFD
ncbi:alpha amylase catalytic region [Oceaniovalibus guishaninsula JLT2003]|uniref:Alpha amylase catalytic region n=1 Tax=Oceaniovalibus guishaninsula JLT2003 TaxID=1231392 RepID=K2I9I1_9RHOB|nr:alpha-amylase family protein [Oceaniovalibus guishaninsula]EKE45620.1 alpha amylase catalytic region [Oceaniovalibus guishaninsula JLT2003]